MALTRAQWDAKMAKLPKEDRTSYDQYLAAQNKSTPTPSPNVTIDPVINKPAPSTSTNNGTATDKAIAEAKAKAEADAKAAADKVALDDAAAKEARRVFDAKNVAFKAKENADNAAAKVVVAEQALADANTAAEAQAAKDALHLATVKADALEAVRVAAAKARQDAIDEAAKLEAAQKAIADAKTAADTAAALEAYNKAEADRNALEATNQAAIDAARIATNAKSIADTVANSRIDSAGNVEYFSQEKFDALTGGTGPTGPTGPTATGPTATGPVITGPTATGPTATGTTATGPTATGTVVPKPTKYTDKFGNEKELDPNFNQIPFDQLSPSILKNITDNAKLNGMTPEAYYAMRGGVNASGYFGDAYGVNSQTGVSLTDEEYAAAIEGKSGAAAGTAVNAALDAKVLEVTGKESPAAAGNAVTAQAAADKAAAEANQVVKDMANPDDPATIAAAKAAAEKAAADKAAADKVAADKAATDKAAADKTAADTSGRQSAYDLLFQQFNAYGLGDLVAPLKSLITQDIAPSEFTLRLRDSQVYKDRFRGNQLRIQNGLAAVDEASYLALEDQYQNVMRNYGLPESYYSRGYLGRQQGLEQFIANDVSARELEDRIMTAQKRVLYANPEVSIALKTFYPDITNGDLRAYALDPTKGMEQINRRITAAEIGASAVQAGLATNVTDAEYLARYGVNKASAQQGYQTIAGGLQRGSQLASIYGENPYTQATASQEVFAVPGAAEAKAAREKITGLEKATFSGQSGLTGGTLARDRAGAF
jgi:hypothetical protein